MRPRLGANYRQGLLGGECQALGEVGKYRVTLAAQPSAQSRCIKHLVVSGTPIRSKSASLTMTAFRGTHHGEFQGLPPTGKQVAFSSMEFNRVVGRQVEEHWVEINLLGLVWQLGVATIPGPRLLIRILVRQAEKLRSRLSTGR